MLELTPGLLDWLAVILTVVAGAPAVRHPGWCADLNTVFSTADVEDSSEQLLRQQSHAIKNQLGHKVTSIQGSYAMLLHVGSLNARYMYSTWDLRELAELSRPQEWRLLTLTRLTSGLLST